MIYPMDDFGNDAKWTEVISGNAEFVERSMNTVKIKLNEAHAIGCLTTVNPVDATAEGILDVEIYADRKAAITGLGISTTQADYSDSGLRLNRDAAYGVICWRHGGAALIMDDPQPPDTAVSLRIVIDANTRTVTYFYDGVEIYSDTISSWFDLSNLYISIYAFATRGDITILDTATFLSFYVPPPTHVLSVDSTPITGVSFNLDGETHTTPYSAELEEGTYTVTVPAQVTVDGQLYNFVSWEDGSTNPSRTINLTTDLSIIATYELAPAPPTHLLTVDSEPIKGVPFTIEKVS